MTTAAQELLALVRDDLQAIESALAAGLTPRYDLVRDVAGHVLFGGGKRLRPLLMVLCARLCGRRTEDIANFAIIFEYLHVATLLHDDVVDGARLRRGKAVAHQVWTPEIAVLAGDFLLARALRLAAATEKMAVIRVIADITENMAQGEIEQLHRKGDITLTEQAYLGIIECKTALLFQGACKISGLIAEAPAPLHQALADYGYNLGMAFQMVDDVLDYTADEAKSGKHAGADLKEGKLTLPVIHALSQAAGTPDYQIMVSIVQDPQFTRPAFERLIGLLQQYGGIRYTQQQAAAYVDRSRKALLAFASSPTRDILFKVADYALHRKK